MQAEHWICSSSRLSVDRRAPACSSWHLQASRDRSSCLRAPRTPHANREPCRAHSPIARSGFLPGLTGLRRNPSANADPDAGHRGTKPSNGRSAAWWIPSPACPGSLWARTLIVSLGVGIASTRPVQANKSPTRESGVLVYKWGEGQYQTLGPGVSSPGGW